jgi:hypothetical protein
MGKTGDFGVPGSLSRISTLFGGDFCPFLASKKPAAL